MATSTEVREDIRSAIGDDGVTLTYTDAQLNIFIRQALNLLSTKVAIAITINTSTGEFSSDPGAEQAALISLQVQCLIARRDFKTAAGKGVRVKQDENEVDTSAGLTGLQSTVDGDYSPCAELDRLVVLYLSSVNGGVADNAEAIWSGNSRIYEDVDHDGQQDERIYRPGPGGHRHRDIDGSYWSTRFLGGY